MPFSNAVTRMKMDRDVQLCSHSECEEKAMFTVLPLVTIKVFQTGEQVRTQKERFLDLEVVNLMQQVHKLVLIIPDTTGFHEEHYT